MRRLFIALIWIPGFAFAQQYQQFDTIGDPAMAIQKIRAAITRDAANPGLFALLAHRKILVSEYDSAIYYANRSIEQLAKQKDDKVLIRALHCKGVAQYYLDDKLKAETNWREALQLAIKENDREKIIKLASNLGAIYLDEVYLKRKEIRNFNIADSFFSIAYRQLQEQDSLYTDQGLRTMRLMATSLHFQKKYDSADHYYKKVLAGSRKINVGTYLGALSFYAEMLSENGRYTEAIGYMKEAIQYADNKEVKSKDKTHIMHVYGNVLYRSGNYQDAYRYNDSSYQLLAADYQKVNADAYSESESKFKNQLLQYQVQLEQQKKNRLYYLLAGLGLLTTITLLWLYNRSKRKIAREKARQKQIAIDAFIEGEEKEKARIGRELHDGIAQEIVAVKLAMHALYADTALIEELNRISLDIRNISHELMPLTLKEYGLKLAVEDICQKILAPSGIHYEVASSLPDERLPNKIEITLYRIFQELVHNIIKHSQATEVLVQLRKMNNHILLTVEDNGKGMRDEKNKGIGINNLKSRVQLLDGNLQYDSSEDEGTTAIVRVPV